MLNNPAAPDGLAVSLLSQVDGMVERYGSA